MFRKSIYFLTIIFISLAASEFDQASAEFKRLKKEIPARLFLKAVEYCAQHADIGLSEGGSRFYDETAGVEVKVPSYKKDFIDFVLITHQSNKLKDVNECLRVFSMMLYLKTIS